MTRASVPTDGLDSFLEVILMRSCRMDCRVKPGNDGTPGAPRSTRRRNTGAPIRVGHPTTIVEDIMGFGRGLLLWLLGIPLPIIILLAIFMHH